MTRHRATTSAARRGFTLPECLAALVLVGVVLPVAMRGITLSMQASARARHLAEATEIAHLKLNELALANDTSAFVGTGEITGSTSTYRWASRSVSRSYGLYELTVEVGWTSAGIDQSTSITTLVYPSSTTSSTAASTSGGTP
jgi:prepilin-type N-terminal cleavage/methylation domain-containing protein